MSAASDILDAVRAALKRPPLPKEQERELEGRMETPPRNPLPGRANLAHRQQVDLFIAEAERVNATVARVEDLAGAAAAVASYLADNGLPGVLRVTTSPALGKIPWSERAALKVAEGKAEPSDPVGVSSAFAGVAETGTLVVASGPDNPTSLCFLPDTHIVVVAASAIVGTYEETWRLLPGQGGGGDFMPRNVIWITGPSRTADIEQTILLGAHGPRRLLIVLVDKAG